MERIKILDRENIVSQTLKEILNEFSNKSTLEFEYENEAGIGLGPTLAYYDLMSKELQRSCTHLWVNESSEGDYVKCAGGIFPDLLSQRQDTINQLSNKQQELYVLTGSLIGKALEDGRLLDMEFSLPMLEFLTNPYKKEITLFDYAEIHPSVINSLNTLYQYLQTKHNLLDRGLQNSEEWKKLASDIESLMLDFYYGTYPLLKNSNQDLSVDNIDLYCESLLDYLSKTGVQEQLWCIEYGINQVLNDGFDSLSCFTPSELSTMICGSSELWNDKSQLLACIQCSHGYSVESETIQYLILWLLELKTEDQRLFLQFVTGSSRLGAGGLQSLHPKLTVVRKTVETSNGNTNVDDMLPTVNTCFHYLKLPPYTTFENLKEKMTLAIKQGSGSFDLS